MFRGENCVNFIYLFIGEFSVEPHKEKNHWSKRTALCVNRILTWVQPHLSGIQSNKSHLQPHQPGIFTDEPCLLTDEPCVLTDEPCLFPHESRLQVIIVPLQRLPNAKILWCHSYHCLFKCYIQQPCNWGIPIFGGLMFLLAYGTIIDCGSKIWQNICPACSPTSPAYSPTENVTWGNSIDKSGPFIPLSSALFTPTTSQFFQPQISTLVGALDNANAMEWMRYPFIWQNMARFNSCLPLSQAISFTCNGLDDIWNTDHFQPRYTERDGITYVDIKIDFRAHNVRCVQCPTHASTVSA